MIAALIAFPAWTGANAQDAEGHRVRIGAGIQVQPEYPGADHSRLGPLFRFDIARGNEIFRFKAPDDSPGIAVVRKNGFAAGPVFNMVASRKDKDVGVPIGKVKTSIELGGFAQYDLTESLRVRGEIRQGVTGHKGLVGQIGVDQVWRDGDRYTFSIGPRVTFAGSRYERAYFGITPAQALATGLPVYDPSGGVLGLAAASGVTFQFSDRFGMFGYARAERLVGDAGKSPLVKKYGSRDQLSAGIGLTYSFRVAR
jgi:outer membrane protein